SLGVIPRFGRRRCQWRPEGLGTGLGTSQAGWFLYSIRATSCRALALPEEDGVEQDPQGHPGIRRALVLDQHADEGGGQLGALRPEGKAEEEIGLAAAPVVEEKRAVHGLDAGEVEAIRQVG